MDNCNAKMFINKKLFLENIEYMEKIGGKPLLPVLKSHAYGFGFSQIAKILYERGHRDFVVARFCEAEILQKFLVDSSVRITIMESMFDLSSIKNNASYIISINSLKELEVALGYGIPSSRMKIKIDFGFGRNGIFYNEIAKVKKIMEAKNLKFHGIYSHFFDMEYEDGLELIEKFKEALKYLGKENFEKIDLQNGKGVINYGQLDFVTNIRCALPTYGLYERSYSQVSEHVKYIFSLRVKISSIKDMSQSKYLAYAPMKKFEPCNKKIAKIKIGYGDGFLKFNEGTTCLINNKEYKILLVTMDNTFVEVDEYVKEFDEVTLYHDINSVSQKLKIVPYGLLIILGDRIERVVYN
ncbi:MAG: alanine racemase [Fusobacteriaceae bacterium]